MHSSETTDDDGQTNRQTTTRTISSTVT